MKSAAQRWGLRVLRYGLCAVAIWYLYNHVPWHDHVILSDAVGTRVRLLEERPDALVILRDGVRAEIGLDQVRRVTDAKLLDIEYGIRSTVRRMNLLYALWAILLCLPAPLLQSFRLVQMLAIQEVRLSYWNAVKLSFAGNFFNYALPGTTGGDLIKAYYITHHTHRKTEAVTTVFLDRVIGLLGLVILAGTLIAVSWDPQKFGHTATIILVVCAGLAVGAVFVFSRRLRNAIGLPRLAQALPMGEQLLRVGRATIAIRKHKALVLAALLNTFVLQGFVILGAYVMAMALDMKGSFVHYFIYVPIGFLIAAVPITPPQAFGVLEWAFVEFFRPMGNTPSQAVTLALAIRIMQLIWALPGVLVPLLGAHIPTQSEMAELEHFDDAPVVGAAVSASPAPQTAATTK